MTWRIYAVVILLTMSIIDLSATYYYIHQYKEWQPDKPYALMEKNPILVFLWERFGLEIGMFIGMVLLLALNFLIARYAHWIIVVILFTTLAFVLYNHYNNITLILKLIAKYPSGHLPEEIFGTVIGNN